MPETGCWLVVLLPKLYPPCCCALCTMVAVAVAVGIAVAVALGVAVAVADAARTAGPPVVGAAAWVAAADPALAAVVVASVVRATFVAVAEAVAVFGAPARTTERGSAGFEVVSATICATMPVPDGVWVDTAPAPAVAGTAAMLVVFATALALVWVNWVAMAPLTAMKAITLLAVTPFLQREIRRMVSAFASCAALGSFGAGLPDTLSVLDILLVLFTVALFSFYVEGFALYRGILRCSVDSGRMPAASLFFACRLRPNPMT